MFDLMLKRVPQLMRTSIAKKFVMGITGLLLVGFLITHLAGNLLLYAGAEAYNEYAHKLHSMGPLLWAAEVGLALLFLAHIYLAFSTARDNWAARKKDYARQETKRERTTLIRPDTFMFLSGAVVMVFVLWHLTDLTFQARPDLDYADKEPFEKTVMVLKNPASKVIYGVGTIVLGLHLSHGIASAFQSLGLRNKNSAKLIHCIGVTLAWVLSLGFFSFVIWSFIALN